MAQKRIILGLLVIILGCGGTASTVESPEPAPEDTEEKVDTVTAIPEDPQASKPTKNIEDYASMGTYIDAEGFAYQFFPTAKDALAALVKAKKPRVIGFGEFHQTEGTKETLSGVERFTEDLLPIIGGVLSDLVVETWIPTGCGEVEKKVVAEVEQVSERPQETENETVKMLKMAETLGVQSHILTVPCEDYKSVFFEDGTVDFFRMLEIVGKLLGQKAAQVLVYRLQEAGKSGKPYTGAIGIYGGAIHNDNHPAKKWAPVSFGPVLAPAVQNSTGGEYIDVDLYVPEFIEDSDIVKDQVWFSFFKENASAKQAILIRLADNSYIIVFRRGIAN